MAADYAITSTTVTRSLPAGFGGVTYSNLSTLLLTVGSGANVISVTGTAAGVPTTVNTNAGTDTVNVTATNATGPLTIDTGSELDTINIGNTGSVGAPGLLTPIAGAITVDGGTGGANLVVDGSGAAVNADYAITSTTVTRSLPAGFGGVTYSNLSTLLLTVGSGAAKSLRRAYARHRPRTDRRRFYRTRQSGAVSARLFPDVQITYTISRTCSVHAITA